MSDSPHKENTPNDLPKSKDLGTKPQKAALGKNADPIKANTPLEPKKSQLPLPIFILSILVLIGLIGFAAVAAMQWVGKQDGDQASLKDQTSAQSDTAPVSILPVEPEGVTILEKQPELAQEDASAPIAPVAQGADIATGFAMDIGAADSFLELSRRFAETVLANGEENFQRLEPRAVLRETITGLEARLLIGPFETEAAAKEACNVLVLSEETTCMPSRFEGELIARE